MAFRIDAVGARVQFLWGKQVDFATPIRPDTRLRLSLPEDLKANRTFEISDEPTPQRDRTDITETSRAANGPLNFDIRTEGLGPIYQAALGSDEDVISLTDVNGAVRCQVSATYDQSGAPTVLSCGFIPGTASTEFLTGPGSITVVYRTLGDTSGQLLASTQTYTSHDGATFTLSAALPGVADGDVLIEDYVFREDSVAYAGVYTHLYAGGQALDTVSTFCILRDIVAFYYYSSKIGTFTETYDNQSVIAGSVEVFAGDEFYGGVLETGIAPAATTLTLADIDRDRELAGIMYPDITPTLHTCWIGTESGVLFEYMDPTPTFTGVMSNITGATVTVAHTIDPEREVVAFASVPAISFSVSDSPLASYNAGVFFRISDEVADVASMEVLSANYTVENNLFTDKIPLGSRDRIALPEGVRDITGTLHIEFDSPVEYNRVTRGTRVRLEIHGIDQINTIAATTVPKRNDTILPKIQFIENAPTVPDTNLIEYDLNFRALAATRWPAILKITVNEQTTALAGG